MYLIRIKRLEEIDRLLEKVDGFLLVCIAGVTSRVEGADARAVLGPLVLPESLVVPLIVLPVRLHVVEEAGLAERGQDAGDVGVRARRVAAGIVGTVAVIRP